MDQKRISTEPSAVKVIVKGRVQGVGFRPFIFQLADLFEIKGTVQNNMDGVKIFAEGSKENLNQFVEAIREKSPRLSRIDQVVVSDIERANFKTFEIIPSERTGKSSLVIPVDSAVCEDCLSEMRDPDNFRYRYPFINCTQCGPRYTIIDALPYDRPYTAMKEFQMCEECASEYEDPMNRRHHAQPIACGSCGPEMLLRSISGERIATEDEAMLRTIELLKGGSIVAIKGLGGYHLVCDASNQLAVTKLRQRKKRPMRPLAVMAGSLEIAKQICQISEKEADILQSPEAPIVVMTKRQGMNLAEGLAPGMSTLGVMLPYTPMHHLLFDGGLNVLVMTSANPSGLPILHRDEEALTYLHGIADFILSNNREILHPVDDSVVQVIDNRLSFFRRARGYVPDPMVTTHSVHRIVALGPQQKNTFAIGRHEQVFLGPHIGEMDNLEVIEHFGKEFNHLMKWMGIEAETVAVDMHPGYATSQMAKEMNGQVVQIQHHHAHMVACMEDNSINEPVFGIILDGTGFGTDGNIWGFEFLHGDANDYKRLAHLQYTHLPGNERAIKEPWRNAAAMLIDYFGTEGRELAEQLFPDRSYELAILESMIKREVNSPLAGTCGRLFDAVSAILGICDVSTYDGEAAIRLSEQMTEQHTESAYSYSISTHAIGEPYIVDFGPALLGIVKDRLNGTQVQTIVQKFHETIVKIAVDMIGRLSAENPHYHKKVVLSGGSFHNRYLTTEIARKLRNEGFNVYTHSRVPCNDGGLSLGQLIVAANKSTVNL